MIAKDIISILNYIAPPYLIDDWDNSGLQIGTVEKEVNKILIALDVTPNVIKEAKLNNIDMIITHHPLFFKKIKNLNKDSQKGKMIFDIIKEDIIVFSVHSNLDLCFGGVSDVLANLLEIKNTSILRKSYEEKLYKLVVFVPKEYADKVRYAITENGGGWIGKYSHCTYNIEGIGTFMPREGSNPFIGSFKKLEKVQETRIETIVKEGLLNEVISNMLSVHPYEEVAYDVYPLANKGIEYGYGRVGYLKEKTTLKEISGKVKNKLNCEVVKVVGDINKEILKVAVCGGSGGDFIIDAYSKGADVYITGDIKYHEAQLAEELGIAVIDAGHYNTEWIVLPKLKEYLEKHIKDNLEIKLFNDKTVPFLVI